MASKKQSAEKAMDDAISFMTKKESKLEQESFLRNILFGM